MKKYTKSLLFVLTMALFMFHTLPAEAATAELNMKTLSLLPGESFKLSVENNLDKVKWSSGKKKVAKVSATGTVTAVSPGRTKITAKVGSKKYTCTVVVRKTVDIIVFCGQSNMTGVGNYYEAPKLTQGAGYAFNYVTNKNNFPVLKEPFGYGQDDSYFMNGDYCKGSMITAFANAYYKQTDTPIIAVPASCVGTGSVSWKDSRYKGVIKRVNAAVKLAKKKKLDVGHVYMVWMQGENDAFADMSAEMHTENLTDMVSKIQKKTPVEVCMIVGIANYNGDAAISKNFTRIQNAQKALCKSNDNFVLISTKASKLSSGYFREDGIHIIQSGLNQIGTHAGKNAGKYAISH